MVVGMGVDGEGVVVWVGMGGLVVVDEGGGECVELEVGDGVRGDEDGGGLGGEVVENGVESRGSGVEVVGVEVEGKGWGERVMEREVGGWGDGEMVRLGNEMNEFVVWGVLVNGVGGGVGRMVVDENEVEGEVCLVVE